MRSASRVWLTVGPVAFAAGIGALVLVLGSSHEENRILVSVFGLLVGWSFVVAGLIAQTRRPENRTGVLAPAYDRRLRSNRKAWAFFQVQPPYYRRTSIFWVMEAKREDTRVRRLEVLIACSAAGKPIPLLTREPATGRRPARRKT